MTHSERTLLHYRLLEKIGEGGMGAVYRALDTKLDREIAVKILPETLALDPERRNRFEREAKTVASLNHPGIVTLFAFEQDGDTRFLTMELVEGSPLEDLIPAGGLPVDRILEIAVPLADALAAAHKAGVIHRDLKPSNVMVTTEGGRVKVLDFGLAKLADDSAPGSASQIPTALTQEGRVMGTPHYMSPEQVAGSAVDARSDIFSLGVVLHELITGAKPFRGDSAAELMSAILRDTPAAIDAEKPGVPGGLVRVVERCLQKNPDDRIQTSRDVLNELRSLGGSGEGAESAPRPATDSPVVAALAVMPFESAGSGDAMDYLGDGLAEGLIATLARLPDVRVMSRHASFALRREPRDIAALGDRLRVDALVLGEVKARGERVVVNVELVRCPGGDLIWGDRYDRSLQDVADVERHVVENVCRELTQALSGEDLEKIDRGPADPRAFLLYVKARSLLIGNVDQMRSAAESLEEAVRLDPEYALAHAALAEAYMLQSYHNVIDTQEARVRSRAAAREAVRLAPDLPEAHTALGITRFIFDWDWEGADESFRKAVAMGPGNDVPHLEYADFLAGVGRLEEAIDMANRARALDPVSPNPTHLVAYTLMLMGDYEGALTEFRSAIALHPNWIWGHIKLSMTYSLSGDHEKALEEVKIAEAALQGAGTPLAWSWVGRVYAQAGHRDRAMEILDRLQDTDEREVEPLTRATVLAGLGDKEGVLANIEHAYRTRSGLCPHLLAVERLVPEMKLADEPRFRVVAKRMRLPGWDS